MTGDEVIRLTTAAGFLITALTSALAMVQSMRNGRNIQIIEKATNSMKDALVASTAKASLAEGTAAGLEQGRTEVRSPPDDPLKVEIVKIPPAR